VKTQRISGRPGRRGTVLTEIIAAIAILAVASIPVAYSSIQEQKAFRAAYYHALAMEVVDGEIEILMAGEWRAFKAGAQDYVLRSDAARNLPAGRCTLTIGTAKVRLEWVPGKPEQGGAVMREFALQQP
jgi:hypothetical protein